MKRSITTLQKIMRSIRTSNVFPVVIERITKRIYPQDSIDIPQCFKVRNFGCTFKGSIDNYIDYHIFFFGGYDLTGMFLTEKIIQRIGRGDILDIGSNVGNHALFYSRFANKVFCFEPNPEVLEKLRVNVSESKAENVVIFDFALSNINGKLRFFKNSERNLGGGSFECGHEGIDPITSQFLVAKRGDDVLPDLGAGINYVKLDVEGHEAKVLQGMKKWSENLRPVFDFEFSKTLKESIGNKNELMALFPNDYTLFGTQQKYEWRALRLIAGYELCLTKFYFDKIYSHAFAIPNEKIKIII